MVFLSANFNCIFSGAWQQILEIGPDTLAMRKFRRYFERNWYPQQSPTVLSCAGQRHRTTNAIEGWNHRLNRRIPKHPNLYDFIDKLRKEAKHYDHIMNDSLVRLIKNKRRLKDVNFDIQYKKCLRLLENDQISTKQFLKKIIFLRLFK